MSSNIPSIAPASQIQSETTRYALYALKGTLLFTLLSLFPLYKLTHMLASKVGQQTLGNDGFPTLYGILLHGVVFFLISFGLMACCRNKKIPIATVVSVLAGLVVIVALIDIYKIRKA